MHDPRAVVDRHEVCRNDARSGVGQREQVERALVVEADEFVDLDRPEDLRIVTEDVPISWKISSGFA